MEESPKLTFNKHEIPNEYSYPLLPSQEKSSYKLALKNSRNLIIAL